MVPLLFLTGCLERVTGEFIPLDPRFTAGHTAGEGPDGAPVDPNAGGTGDGVYIGYKGATVKLQGVVESTQKYPIQIDVNEFDATVEGGVKRVGALHLPEPGTFEADVPASVERLQLRAFQDPAVDGPSDTDPFAELTVAIAGAQPEPLTIVLVVGARGKAQAGPEAAPPSGGQATNTAFFPPGPRVMLRGTILSTRKDQVSLDFFKKDGQGEGGRSFLFKLTVGVGPWEQEFPTGYGTIEVEAYMDLAADGPSLGDPRAAYAQQVDIGGTDVSGIEFEIQ